MPPAPKMKQMLSAVAYLHHKGVVHRDLKARRSCTHILYVHIKPKPAQTNHSNVQLENFLFKNEPKDVRYMLSLSVPR